MPLADLLGKRERTASGAEVSAPTVRTFFRALEVFGTEIGIVREASRSVADGLPLDIALAPFLVNPEDGRLAYVLEGLWKPEDGAALVEVAKAAARFVEPVAGRVDGMLGVPGGEVEETEDVEAGVLLVFGCAERFKIDPLAVMDWPLGMFLDAIQAFSRPPREVSPATDEMIGSIFPTITASEAGEAPAAAA